MKFPSTVGSFQHPVITEGVQQLLSSLDDGIFVLDTNLHLVYFNQRVRDQILNYFNFTCEVGEAVMNYLPEERRDILSAKFMGVLQGETFRYVQEIEKDHGITLWVDCYYFPLRDVDGIIIGMGGMLKDITEIRNYRNQLEEKTEKLNTILESITDGFFTMDRNWIISYTNRKAAALVGLTPEDAVGKSMKELFPNPTTTIFFDAYRKAFETGKPVNAEGYFSPLDRWLDISVYPAGNLLTIYARDVTERKRLEEKILQIRINEQKMVIRATLQGQEKEREILSRELHENISQALTTTKLSLELIGSHESGHNTLLQKSIKTLSEVINNLRLISYSLLPHTIDDIGIADAIRELVQPYTQANKFQVQVAFEGTWEMLSRPFKVNLFRIIQERLHVIAILEQAKEVKINLRAGEGVELVIEDDGRDNELKGIVHISFATIRNRTELFDGTTTISTSQKGAVITLQFPMAACCQND